MRTYWASGRRFHGRLLAELAPYRCDHVEELRQAQIADWRRKYHKTMLLKALGGVGLIILICGGTLSVLYALNW